MQLTCAAETLQVSTWGAVVSKQTCTATVCPPIQLPSSSMSSPNWKARLVLSRSPCRSPMAMMRSAAGRKVTGSAICRQAGKMMTCGPRPCQQIHPCLASPTCARMQQQLSQWMLADHCQGCMPQYESHYENTSIQLLGLCICQLHDAGSCLGSHCQYSSRSLASSCSETALSSCNQSPLPFTACHGNVQQAWKITRVQGIKARLRQRWMMLKVFADYLPSCHGVHVTADEMLLMGPSKFSGEVYRQADGACCMCAMNVQSGIVQPQKLG